MESRHKTVLALAMALILPASQLASALPASPQAQGSTIAASCCETTSACESCPHCATRNGNAGSSGGCGEEDCCCPVVLMLQPLVKVARLHFQLYGDTSTLLPALTESLTGFQIAPPFPPPKVSIS